MTPRNSRPGNWIAMPADWMEDDEILRLNSGARLTLLGVITLCARGRSDGRISEAQLRHIATLSGKPKAVMQELLDKRVLIAVDERRSEFAGVEPANDGVGSANDGVGSELGRDSSELGRSSSVVGSANVGGEPEFVLRLADKWLAYASVAAAQSLSPNNGHQSASRARPPARVKKQTDIQTDKPTTSRPASPDGRDVVVARAAPLAPSDAPRHAPGVFAGPVREPQENPVVSLQSPSAESRPALKNRLSDLEAKQALSKLLRSANGQDLSGDEIRNYRNAELNSGEDAE